jgi:hypothetical protein
MFCLPPREKASTDNHKPVTRQHKKVKPKPNQVKHQQNYYPKINHYLILTPTFGNCKNPVTAKLGFRLRQGFDATGVLGLNWVCFFSAYRAYFFVILC